MELGHTKAGSTAAVQVDTATNSNTDDGHQLLQSESVTQGSNVDSPSGTSASAAVANVERASKVGNWVSSVPSPKARRKSNPHPPTDQHTLSNLHRENLSHIKSASDQFFRQGELFGEDSNAVPGTVDPIHRAPLASPTPPPTGSPLVHVANPLDEPAAHPVDQVAHVANSATHAVDPATRDVDQVTPAVDNRPVHSEEPPTDVAADTQVTSPPVPRASAPTSRRPSEPPSPRLKAQLPPKVPGLGAQLDIDQPLGMGDDPRVGRVDTVRLNTIGAYIPSSTARLSQYLSLKKGQFGAGSKPGYSTTGRKGQYSTASIGRKGAYGSGKLDRFGTAKRGATYDDFDGGAQVPSRQIPPRQAKPQLKSAHVPPPPAAAPPILTDLHDVPGSFPQTPDYSGSAAGSDPFKFGCAEDSGGDAAALDVKGMEGQLDSSSKQLTSLLFLLQDTHRELRSSREVATHAVATIQRQASTITSLEDQVQQLKAELRRLNEEC